LALTGVVCGEGGWVPPQKKIIFVPKMISLGAFCRSFNRQKTRKPWDMDFTVQSQNYKACKNSAKVIQKFS